MKSATAEAWAKFIVSGEHAVLNGAPCLVYPLRQAQLRITARVNSPIFCASLNGALLSAERLEKLCSAALLAGWSTEQLQSTQLDIASAIPLGSGLGSSAALCVCLARLSGSNPSEEDVFDAALRAESVFHGRSSGADPAAVSTPYPIFYTMAGKVRKRFEPASGAPFAWVLRNSGASRESGAVISNLDNSSAQQILRDQLKLFAFEIPELLRRGDWARLPEAIEELNGIHRKMGLVNEALERTFVRMKTEGAVACKLTGAGRGGYALGLYPLTTLRALPKSEVFVASLNGNNEDIF